MYCGAPTDAGDADGGWRNGQRRAGFGSEEDTHQDAAGVRGPGESDTPAPPLPLHFHSVVLSF